MLENSSLDQIPGIDPPALELLEVAGFLDIQALAKAGVDELCREFERANKILKIADTVPTRDQVKQWIRTARKLTGESPLSLDSPIMPVNYEALASVQKMITAAPFALPMPARKFVENDLAVADIPPAIFLNRYAGDLEVRVESRATVKEQVRAIVPSGATVKIETVAQKKSLDIQRLRSTGEFGGVSQITPPSVEMDRRSLLRTPLDKTNAGKSPSSRSYIRGVLHNEPITLWMGALITLCIILLTPFAIVSGLLLLISDQDPARFSWVPQWILCFPLSLPVLGLGYLYWGLSGNCRVCGQKLFVPRHCLKNSKAHHLPGLGNMLPLCLHILVFRWFRCTYCGTPVRLKK